MDFDKLLDYIGDFGYYQKTIYFISCTVSIFVGMHMLSNVFTMAVPKSRCSISGCDNGLSQYSVPWMPFTVPVDKNGQYSQCLQFQFANGTNFTCASESFLNSTTIECQNGWVWDRSEFDSTTVTEWNLTCSNSWVVSLSQSLFMAGVLFGSMIFGTVSDRFGRRLVFFITPILVVTSSIGAAFATNWAVYTAIKFIIAIAINGIFQTGFVVVVEFIGISKRAWCGNMIQVFFAVGELVLAGIAYCIRDWRDLQLTISIPLGLLLFYPCLVPESVRWLLSRGRFTEAKSIILKVADKNRKSINTEVIEEFLENASRHHNLISHRRSGYLDLFKSPILLRRSLNIFFNWMVNSLVYYGLSLSASNLSGSTYVNFVALAAVEVPAVILATVVQQWKGRRLVLCSVLLIGGLSCIISALIPKEYAIWSTILAVFGKSNIAASFAVIYIYTAEIFPTPLRTTGIGISSTFSRIGGIVAPIIADLGNYNQGLPMYIFGGSSVAAGVLSLALPETHNRKLPETIEEAERFGRSNRYKPLVDNAVDHDYQDVSQTPLLSEKSR